MPTLIAWAGDSLSVQVYKHAKKILLQATATFNLYCNRKANTVGKLDATKLPVTCDHVAMHMLTVTTVTVQTSMAKNCTVWATIEGMPLWQTTSARVPPWQLNFQKREHFWWCTILARLHLAVAGFNAAFMRTCVPQCWDEAVARWPQLGLFWKQSISLSLFFYERSTRGVGLNEKTREKGGSKLCDLGQSCRLLSIDERSQNGQIKHRQDRPLHRGALLVR